MTDRETWETLGRQLRIDSIRASSAAGSGHPTSSMSAADLMAVLLERYLHYDFETPERPTNDHLVFSKGHASPLLYAMYRAAGAIDDAELLSYRQHGSPCEEARRHDPNRAARPFADELIKPEEGDRDRGQGDYQMSRCDGVHRHAFDR